MGLAVLYSRAGNDIQAPLITIEVYLSGGLPTLSIVGLPETAIKESKDRVRAAILNAGFSFPAQRITINLAPADLPKDGSHFDLPIAIGILVASKQLNCANLSDYEFAGELALTGELRKIKGALPVAVQTTKAGRLLVIPKVNVNEASLVSHCKIITPNTLLEVYAHLSDREALDVITQKPKKLNESTELIDFNQVKGQFHAKRALEIAAAGGHNLLFIGPPGTGKTMLASRLPTILPSMSEEEALETAMIASISQQGFDAKYWKKRPFRAPHHTASGPALVGGSSQPKPGEISLAHNGVLFLDELPEFDRKVLEVLREPLESKQISIVRSGAQATFPANFQLIAAMNPCPRGYCDIENGNCFCSSQQVNSYRNRISGPLLDRIDIHLEVPQLKIEELTGKGSNKDQQPIESSAQIKERVTKARHKQQQRRDKINALLIGQEIEQDCVLADDSMQLLTFAANRLNFSARAYHKILKLARTIADLDEKENILKPHLMEAISYRQLDARNQAGRTNFS